MGINHNRRVLFWWSKLFAAEERRVSFGAASQLSCQILPRCRSTRESGFSSMSNNAICHADSQALPLAETARHYPSGLYATDQRRRDGLDI